MRSHRQRERERADRLGKLLIVVIVGVVIGAGSLVWTQRSAAIALDASGCPVSGDLPQVAILVDRSDALSPRQKSAVQRRVGAVLAESPVGARLSLHVLDPADTELVRELFSGCRPPDGTAANRWVENERRLRERWETEFRAPLERTLARTLADNPTRTSPLLEAVQSIALSTLSGSRSVELERRLLIVSDMIHHTPEYSHYRDSLDYERFRALPYARRVHAPLDGVQIDVAYVGRPAQDHVQTNAHGLFWDRHLTAQGGTLRSIVRLPGG